MAKTHDGNQSQRTLEHHTISLLGGPFVTKAKLK